MAQSIMLGGLAINKAVLVYGLGFLLAYLILRKQDRQLLSLLSYMILITLFFYRFGGFFFDPGMYLKNPLLFLQANGGTREWVTGLLAAMMYVMVMKKRHSFGIGKLADIAAVGFFIITFVKNLFFPIFGDKTSLPWGISINDGTQSYHPINLYYCLLILILAFILWKRHDAFGNGRYFTNLMFYWGFGTMLISHLNSQPITFLYLTNDQWMSVLFMLAGGLFTFYTKGCLVNEPSSV
ncbi:MULTISPECIES: prolipoprotein diacylglyceryl transferase family protein [Heyndrickxia]|nr:prolipoprotein diacylglyceryl transferase family protein [Heyndrickxia coagulans]MED4346396.1 prolipoprotein diacylglyceryl transferase [Heyndrickxia coagulans]